MLKSLCSKQISRNKKAIKYMWKLNDDLKIGAVLFYLPYRNVMHSICTSTQAGCVQGCRFCATGRKGVFLANLDTEDIVKQVQSIVEDNSLEQIPFEVAFMATGEPLLNYDNVMDSIRKMHQIYSSFVQVNLSTIGIPKIYDFADEEFDDLTIKLQISLHHPENEKRDIIMPSKAKFNIKEALEAGKYFSEKKDRKVSLNYLLLKGFNDDEETISKLISLVKPYSEFFYIKISRMNEVDKSPDFLSPEEEIFEGIKERINRAGIECKIFFGDGNDIAGNCGQLFI